jgi:hypothetical protein
VRQGRRLRDGFNAALRQQHRRDGHRHPMDFTLPETVKFPSPESYPDRLPKSHKHEVDLLSLSEGKVRARWRPMKGAPYVG